MTEGGGITGTGASAMRFGSLFSGIEAASVAWEPLGWQCAWVAEIDPFACAVLAHRYPAVPNLGDVMEIDADAVEPVDLVVFGSPCQSFSGDGKRLGLDDPRGNLAPVALRLISGIRPRWLVFENVPGLLSSDGGRDFGAFLGLMAQCGYGFAYRVLDAQNFGVPQRRRRVFVVGYFGDWRPPAAVLLEPESLRGDTAPRREAGQRTAPSLTVGTHGCGGHQYRQRGNEDALIAQAFYSTESRCDNIPPPGVSPPLKVGSNGGGQAPAIAFNNTGQGWWNGAEAAASAAHIVAHSLRADGFDASEDGTGRGTPIIPIQYADQLGREKRRNRMGLADDGAPMFTLERRQVHSVGYGMSVRKLTPVECERLMGLPDNWTNILYRSKPAADGPRYRAIGNSMAVPVVNWIGERIQALENAKGSLPEGGVA